MGNCCKKRTSNFKKEPLISFASMDNSKDVFIPIQRTEKEKKERLKKKKEKKKRKKK